MNLTRQHFELVAQVLRESVNGQEDGVTAGASNMHRDITLAFSDAFKATNPRFNPSKFIEACGYRK